MKQNLYRLLFCICILLQVWIAEGQSLSSQKLIKSVEIAGVPQTLATKYSVKSFQNTLKINFNTSATSERIYFRLIPTKNKKGDIKWHKSNSDFAFFTDLDNGKYIFETALNQNNKLVKSESFQLVISLVWWRSWLAYVSLVFIIGLILFWKEIFEFNKTQQEKELGKKISELELRTLQLQMNPHFIFNALNSIQSYIITNETIKANEYLTKFANLIRLFLESSRKKTIPISEENRLLDLYCEIEKLRFEDKFDFEIDIAPNVNIYMEIPTMMIQPFVENAINHGLRYKSEAGLLKISFSQNQDFIICEVIDNGVGRKMSKLYKEINKRAYMPQGIKIIEERKETFNFINDTNIHFFIEDAYIKSENSPTLLDNLDVGTHVTIKFPI